VNFTGRACRQLLSDTTSSVPRTPPSIGSVASKPNLKLGSFGRDARDAKDWTTKGASFVALASTLLIAQKFREVVAELYPHKT
jgi:hypothetical protein